MAIKDKLKNLGLKGVNKPKLTRGHATKKAIVLSTIGPGQEGGKVIRFGDQKMGNNYNPEARKAFKSRHQKNISRGPMSAAYWADKVKWSPSKTKSNSSKWKKGS